MTCIAGLVQDGNVYIGGDSAGVDPGRLNLMVRADQKVFVNGPMIFGFTTSFRMGQLLRYALKIPLHDPQVEVYTYMVTTFVDAVRNCLKSGGYAAVKDGAEEAGTFLCGYRGRLFFIDCDYQVGETLDHLAAVGCGAAYALGALHVTEGLDPEERIMKALFAAERCNAGVRGPFNVVKLLAGGPGW